MEGGGNGGAREGDGTQRGREGREVEVERAREGRRGQRAEGGGKGGAREGDGRGAHLHLHRAARGHREGGPWVCTHTCSKEMAGARGREGEGQEGPERVGVGMQVAREGSSAGKTGTEWGQ